MEKRVVGRAEQTLVRLAPWSPDQVSLDFAVYVFKDPADVGAIVNARRKYLSNPGYVECLRQALRVPVVLSDGSTAPSKPSYVLSYEIPDALASGQFETYGSIWERLSLA
jgi:hypothetical protein